MKPAVDVTLTGQRGATLSAAAERVALALVAAGAQVECTSLEYPPQDTGGSLRGAVVRVRVVSDALLTPPLFEAPPLGKPAGNFWRIALAVLLLLALLDAEVRLHFGPRLDVIILGFGGWCIWRWVNLVRSR